MEFLSIMFFLGSIGVIFFSPQKETLAYSLFWVATGICFVMYFIASIDSILPWMAY